MTVLGTFDENIKVGHSPKKFKERVMWEYTDKVKEHFLNPRNVGEVENPDGVAEVGSIA